jgi:hypothetical protein
MTYHQRLMLFAYYADLYGLTIIKPKYQVDDNDYSWVNE